MKTSSTSRYKSSEDARLLGCTLERHAHCLCSFLGLLLHCADADKSDSRTLLQSKTLHKGLRAHTRTSQAETSCGGMQVSKGSDFSAAQQTAGASLRARAGFLKSRTYCLQEGFAAHAAALLAVPPGRTQQQLDAQTLAFKNLQYASSVSISRRRLLERLLHRQCADCQDVKQAGGCVAEASTVCCADNVHRLNVAVAPRPLSEDPSAKAPPSWLEVSSFGP